MMTMTTSSLAADQQALIDARLDTIERMLMGRIPRSDRIDVVREVELQIYELLGDRDPQLVTSEDVLEILRRLDPPEAYLANEMDESLRSTTFQTVKSVSTPKPRRPISVEGRIAGITGLCSFGLIPMLLLLYVIAALTDSEVILMFGSGALTLLGIPACIVGLVLCIRCCREGALPICGLVTSCLAFPIWVIWLPILFLNAM